MRHRLKVAVGIVWVAGVFVAVFASMGAVDAIASRPATRTELAHVRREVPNWPYHSCRVLSVRVSTVDPKWMIVNRICPVGPARYGQQETEELILYRYHVRSRNGGGGRMYTPAWCPGHVPPFVRADLGVSCYGNPPWWPHLVRREVECYELGGLVHWHERQNEFGETSSEGWCELLPSHETANIVEAPPYGTIAEWAQGVRERETSP